MTRKVLVFAASLRIALLFKHIIYQFSSRKHSDKAVSSGFYSNVCEIELCAWSQNIYFQYQCENSYFYYTVTLIRTCSKMKYFNLLRTGLVDISTTNFVRHSTWQIIWFYVQILYKKKNSNFKVKIPVLKRFNYKLIR